MSKRYVKSHSKSKRTFIENYKGFDIVKVEEYLYRFDYLHQGYDTKHTEKRIWLTFTKQGKFNSPKERYIDCYHVVDDKQSIDGACMNVKNDIDKFLLGKAFFMTEKEHYKEIVNYDAMKDWGFSFDDLMKMLESYKNGTIRERYIITERLHDCNFHSFASLLNDGDYEAYKKKVNDEMRY